MGRDFIHWGEGDFCSKNKSLILPPFQKKKKLVPTLCFRVQPETLQRNPVTKVSFF